MDNADRYDDRLVLRTNLIDTYERLLAFGQRHLPDRFHLEGAQAISVRDVIVRELVSNLLVHREYTDPRAGRVVVRRDCVETTNPSRARFAGSITLDDFEPAPKNPLIANFFTQIGRAEDLGSGTRNLYKYAPSYGGRDPELADGDMFTARVWTTFAGAGQTKGASPLDAELLEIVSRYQPARSADIVAMASASERTVKRHLAHLVSEGLLLAEGTTRDRRYRLP